jgi:hypothetical protein
MAQTSLRRHENALSEKPWRIGVRHWPFLHGAFMAHGAQKTPLEQKKNDETSHR